jgi:uncharacterized OsmC-like protein
MADEIPFSNKVAWKEGVRGEISFPTGNAVEFALPAEFGGVEGYLSPEDLYVAAANACVLTTTLTRMKKYGVTLKSYQASAEGFLRKVEDGREIAEINIKVNLKTDGDRETVDKMVAEIKNRVPVIRSMKTEVNLDMVFD